MSQWTEFSYRYDGSYAGFLTCVFESYARRELTEQFSTAQDPRVTLSPERAEEPPLFFVVVDFLRPDDPTVIPPGKMLIYLPSRASTSVSAPAAQQ